MNRMDQQDISKPSRFQSAITEMEKQDQIGMKFTQDFYGMIPFEN